MYIQQVSQVCWIYHFLDLDSGSRYHPINPTFGYLPFISCQHQNSISPKVWQLRSENDVDVAIPDSLLMPYGYPRKKWPELAGIVNGCFFL